MEGFADLFERDDHVPTVRASRPPSRACFNVNEYAQGIPGESARTV